MFLVGIEDIFGMYLKAASMILTEYEVECLRRHHDIWLAQLHPMKIREFTLQYTRYNRVWKESTLETKKKVEIFEEQLRMACYLRLDIV